MSKEKGSALVQVLVMSVLLIILATGVMKIMFMNHVLVARVASGDRYRDWVDRCYALKSVEWGGAACGGSSSDSCNFTGLSGPVVNISCQAGGRVVMTATW